MTLDEARLEFFEAVAKVALKIRVRERNLIEATGDAYAHAAEDALDVERRTQIVMEANHDEGQYEKEADTLGLLETVRHYLTETPRYMVRSGRNSEYIGQDEIVAAIDTALLAGKGER